ncbi:aminotransferase class IV family protein [Nitratiruptor sp. YY09-18]|uniref:aminotransferase class IV family protein n=1 Tax=Nitratiruptor sp. YY09-18 TaxID=2724901 RepID=UPI001916B1A5|nr:aminotransferase class IV family protein [Nitratiruptor sp. YY09-18]BCD68570.1 4-amino-4-deoxychorismate lyase [Nitratiruptor sp. YY09-18]
MKKLFFETIRIENGEIKNISYHNRRCNETRHQHFQTSHEIDLEEFINPPKKGLFRCKIIYAKNIESTNYYPYTPKIPHSFSLQYANIEYSYKYLDRSKIDALKQQSPTDDIIIVKEGLLTDTSIANIAFWYKGEWLTPASPLLPGTTRARLLEQRRIKEAPLTPKECKKFDKMAIMNAMIDFCILDSFIIKGL